MVFIDKKNFPQSNVWRVSKYGINRRGYSILELMVVIALVSIISALSIPSFLQWRQETELKHVLRTVAEMAHNARVYAMTSNTPTHLYIGMLDNSCVLVSTDKNCSCITSANSGS
jgi:prepilin-type N-terminal cleavage/methylation domain-containing protein